MRGNGLVGSKIVIQLREAPDSWHERLVLAKLKDGSHLTLTVDDDIVNDSGATARMNVATRTDNVAQQDSIEAFRLSGLFST